MSQTFRRALSNSGRDGKFWDIRNIVPSRGLICSFWFSRELHLPSHHEVVGQASEPLSLLRNASTCSNTRHISATLALQRMHTAIVVASRS